MFPREKMIDIIEILHLVIYRYILFIYRNEKYKLSGGSLKIKNPG